MKLTKESFFDFLGTNTDVLVFAFTFFLTTVITP